MTQFSEDDVTDFLACDWSRGSSEHLRNIFGKIFGKGSESKEKKRGRVAGGKSEGGVGGVGQKSVGGRGGWKNEKIKKLKKLKN